MNSAVSILGAKYIINDMSKNGRDKMFPKGILAGIIIGAIATVIPNIAPNNKVKPKDAASNLSYVFTNLVYGLLTTFAAAKLGHDSLFDTPPQNDYLKPTEQTSEQKKLTQIAQAKSTPVTTNQVPRSRPSIPSDDIVDEPSNLIQ